MAITRRTQIFSISIEECHWLENLVFGFEKIVRTSGAYDPGLLTWIIDKGLERKTKNKGDQFRWKKYKKLNSGH